MNIGTILRQAVLRDPTKDAVVDGDRRITYTELDAEVNRVANALKKIGVSEGGRVAYFMMNSAKLLFIALGVQRSGAVGVPVNFRLAPTELATILNLSGATVLFYDSELAEAVAQARPQISAVRHWIEVEQGDATETLKDSVTYADFVARANTQDPGIDVDPQAPSLIMYTSGTTGLPKGVVLTHYQQWINNLSIAIELGFESSDRTLHIAPLFHVAAYHVFFLPLLQLGATNVIQRRFNPESALRVIEQEGITSILGVPTHFDRFAETKPSGAPPSLRLLATTGAPIRPDVLDWLKTHLTPNIYNVYGLTETTSLLSVLPPDQLHRMGKINCIGRPLINTELRVVPLDVDKECANPKEVPIGELGQLIARSPKTMFGYEQDADKTAEVLRHGWFYTRDIVRRDENGYLYLVDRVDDVIISGAENIYPAEVQQVLNTHPDVIESAVVGQEDAEFGEVVHAFIVTQKENLTAEDLDRYCRDSGLLARYKRPRRFTFVNAIPKNASGKILKNELRAQLPRRLNVG